MSTLLQKLVHEHDNILAALAALQTFAAKHARQAPDARERLADFIVFFRDYLDRYHHGKEEGLLFPAMVDGGLPQDVGPIGCMMHEHTQGRALVTSLAAITRGEGTLTATEHAVLCEQAVAFANLLSSHIAKENQVLYPMAARMLDGDRMAALDRMADEHDSGWGEGGAKLVELGSLLGARYAATA